VKVAARIYITIKGYPRKKSLRDNFERKDFIGIKE
jgi:hypothetical protein